MIVYVILIILLVLLCLFLISRFRIRITKYPNQNFNIDLYLFFIRYLRIDIDQLIDKYVSKIQLVTTLEDIQNIYKQVVDHQPLIKDLLRRIRVDQISMIINSSLNANTFPYNSFIHYQSLSAAKALIDNSVSNVLKENYQVLIGEKDGSFELYLEISMKWFQLIAFGFKHLKDLFKLLKIRKQNKIKEKKYE